MTHVEHAWYRGTSAVPPSVMAAVATIIQACGVDDPEAAVTSAFSSWVSLKHNGRWGETDDDVLINVVRESQLNASVKNAALRVLLSEQLQIKVKELAEVSGLSPGSTAGRRLPFAELDGPSFYVLVLVVDFSQAMWARALLLLRPFV